MKLPFSLDGSVYVRANPGDGLHIGTDADSALYTGVYLAALACKYETMTSGADRVTVAVELRDVINAVIRMTTDLGPGIISRMLIPVDGLSWPIFGFDMKASPQIKGNTWGERIKNGKVFGCKYPEFDEDEYAYYTDATRDQLTGIVFGFAMCNALPSVKELLQSELHILKLGLSKVKDELLDPNGGHHGSAYKLDGALKEIIRWIKVPEVNGSLGPRKYPENLCLSTFHYNTIFTRRFVFHLRLLQAATLHLLGVDTSAWAKKTFSYVEKDNNPQFKALLNICSDNPIRFNAHELANLGISNHSPYPKFFRWEKPPEEWNIEKPNNVGPGLDYFVPKELMGFFSIKKDGNKQ